jgi:hypothetical protein
MQAMQESEPKKNTADSWRQSIMIYGEKGLFSYKYKQQACYKTEV